MANLSTYINGYVQDPYTQAAFAIWSNYSASQGGCSVYDHNYNCMGRFMMGNGNTGSAIMSSTGAPELFDTYAGTAYSQTNGNTASNAGYAMSPWCGYLGHIVFPMGWAANSNAALDMSGTTSYTYRAYAFRDCGVIVGETKQDYCIFLSNGSFRVGPRSATWYSFQVGTHGVAGQYITLTGKNSGYTGTTYGACSYNATTNKLLVIESNGSYGWKPTIYNNVPGLRYYSDNMFRGDAEQFSAYTTGQTGALYTYFSTSANYSTTYGAASGKPRNANTEDNQRCIPVMCDDGSVVMFQMIPGGNPNAWVTRWNSSGTNAGSLKTWTGTTSYGLDQGAQYGARHVVSSDGKYVIAYAPYYYYGSGSHSVLIRVSDGKILWDENNDTSYTFTYTPIGKSDFACFSSVNADGGAGQYVQHINTEQRMNETADNSQINLCRSMTTQLLSSNFYSTDYPTIIPLQYDTNRFTSIGI